MAFAGTARSVASCRIFPVDNPPQDSVRISRIGKKIIFPSALLTMGLILNGSRAEKQFQTYVRNYTGDGFRVHVDDYLQYAPIVQIIASDIAGLRAKHHWFDQFKYLLISQAVTVSITSGLKELYYKQRPDGMPHSFPSGHTSFAFVNAGVFRHEFESSAPVWAYSGYLMALTTGPMRIANNRHWVSDVLTGAGIAMLVTEFVYHIEPMKSWNPFVKTGHEVSLIPYSGNAGSGVWVVVRF